MQGIGNLACRKRSTRQTVLNNWEIWQDHCCRIGARQLLSSLFYFYFFNCLGSESFLFASCLLVCGGSVLANTHFSYKMFQVLWLLFIVSFVIKITFSSSDFCFQVKQSFVLQYYCVLSGNTKHITHIGSLWLRFFLIISSMFERSSSRWNSVFHCVSEKGHCFFAFLWLLPVIG